MSNMPSSHLASKVSSRVQWWWLLACLYCLSGFTSLAYEVLWARMLSMQFGVSIFGVVLAVAAFMFGLGLGSLQGGRWAKLCNKPLQVFAILEVMIAIYALLLPGLLHFINGWLDEVANHLSLMQWYLLQGTEALGLLVIPAFAMGVGFAMVLQSIRCTPLSLGKLYGLNTMGGVAGALFPLWSLPTLGWINSVRVIAVLGLIIGGFAMVLAHLKNSDTRNEHAESSVQSRPTLSALLLYAGVGGFSIMLEIGWVRLYGMVMLRTEYVLGVILAVFLLGVALGSIFVPRKQKQWIAIFIPFVIGGGVLFGLWSLPALSAWVEQSQFQSFFGAIGMQALVLGLFTLPVTLALGAWLPILAARYANEQVSGVWLYGANCLGGGVGAIVACLVCIPLLGGTGMVALAGIGIAALGLVSVNARWTWLGLAVMVLLAWPLRVMPPVRDLLPKYESNSRDLYLYEDAISLTHVVQQKDGQRILLSDLQRMDASSDPSAVEIQKDQARLAMLLHPDPHTVLFLGLGTGISMAGALPFPAVQRSAVELSQGAIVAAGKWFVPVNDNVMQQTKIQRDDARHFLSTTTNNYDVIIGDLFHPDLAGMGSLLSVQQFQRAKEHLNPNGLFVQWLALNQFDIQSLQVVLNSFHKIFPNAQLFMDGMHLALVGPKNDFSGADAVLKNLRRLSEREQMQATGGEGAWTWLGRYWGTIADQGEAIQDEWMPYVEFNLPRARYDGNVNLAAMMTWLLQRHPDGDAAVKLLGIRAEDRSNFGRAYVATEFSARAWVASIQGDSAKAGKLVWLAYQANPQDRWIANALADNMLMTLSQAGQHGFNQREALQKILGVYPAHVGALRAIRQLEQSAGNVQEAEAYRSRILAVSPLDGEAAAQ